MYQREYDENVLQEVVAPVVEKSQCPHDGFDEVLDICTEFKRGRDFETLCLHGAPLICKDEKNTWKVYGIMKQRCVGLSKYNLHSKISAYRTWIDEVIKS